MSSKYKYLDDRLLDWIQEQRTGLTTLDAWDALGLKTDLERRHVSRRFSRLAESGVLACRMNGTSRVCDLVKELPGILSKPRATPMVVNRAFNRKEKVRLSDLPKVPSIPARNSEEFIKAGGKIEVLPNEWDKNRLPSSNFTGLNSTDAYWASMD